MLANNILVWHQSLCTQCRRYAKCPEWHEILYEFHPEIWGKDDLAWLG